ncbi:MAG: dienelactone hydrolase family protein [Pseudomonadota bacterium]|nr:dienelactone hydrolase family protein [Pseudomonadota bacterium]
MSTPYILDGPIFKPKPGNIIKSAVIMLHGYGADGNDLIQLAPMFSHFLPDTIFFSPHAPDKTSHGVGRQWFNIDFYTPELIRENKSELVSLLSKMHQGAQRSSSLINDYIKKIKIDYKLTNRNIMLVGFSQGTMMAISNGLLHENALAGIVGFSGALMGEKEIIKNIKSPSPVLLIHGNDDDLIPPEATIYMHDTLKKYNIEVSHHILNNVGHNINEEGISIAKEFLLKYLN